ncbi:membrane protein, putative [Babesia bigemina]|uniref:Membrane protein, putative n=1 Tax=Babesia bigemina TaxID=5866 RepID=A0A061DC71_BABBI|nr:membrane protein, putative [Babesia bigemina]CDR95370.1 membrane protein, putative [Babesia bigemina]|eukprot:XP_012767556.1 membrane protein, putative [Babesia bigemina]
MHNVAGFICASKRIGTSDLGHFTDGSIASKKRVFVSRDQMLTSVLYSPKAISDELEIGERCSEGFTLREHRDKSCSGVNYYKVVSKAYKVLSDPTLRAMYDANLKSSAYNRESPNCANVMTGSWLDCHADEDYVMENDSNCDTTSASSYSPENKMTVLSGRPRNIFGSNGKSFVRDYSVSEDLDIVTEVGVGLMDLIFGGTVEVSLNKFGNCQNFSCDFYVATSVCLILFMIAKIISADNENEYFEGQKVCTTAASDYADGVLGVTIDVKTFCGTKHVNVPQGTQHCDEVLVGNYEGIEHVIKIHVSLPIEPSQEEISLLSKIRDLKQRN